LNEREYIIWPAYFDSTIPRRLGRKVPIKEAVKNPSIEELIKVCKELGLEYEVNTEAKYPRTWYIHRGDLRVKYQGPKTRLLHMIGEKLVELRSRSSTGIKR